MLSRCVHLGIMAGSRVTTAITITTDYASRTSRAIQIAMHERHRRGALADGGRHPFDRTVAHIAGGEHARHAGFQIEWIAIQRPAQLPLRAAQVRARTDIAASIANDA